MIICKLIVLLPIFSFLYAAIITNSQTWQLSRHANNTDSDSSAYTQTTITTSYTACPTCSSSAILNHAILPTHISSLLFKIKHHQSIFVLKPHQCLHNNISYISINSVYAKRATINNYKNNISLFDIIKWSNT